MDIRKGFTLIEMAIVLVVMGLLVGMGASLFGVLSKQKRYRENRERMRSNLEVLIQFALENDGLLLKNCTSYLRYRRDVYGKEFLCIVAQNLDQFSACAKKFTNLEVEDEEGHRYQNVALVLISGGPNNNIQTSLKTPIKIYPFHQPEVDDYPFDLNNQRRPEPYDDQVLFLTLHELKEKVLCEHSEKRLHILNDSLPQAWEGKFYKASIYVEGGVPFKKEEITSFSYHEKYEWCVEGNLPSGLSISCLQNHHCQKCGKEISLSGTPGEPGSYKITFRVRDAEQNEVSKNFVITVNPASNSNGGRFPLPLLPRPFPHH